MKTWKSFISILVLLPFILSVSGVLVIQSHCNCTGSNKTSLYLAPETCADLDEEHHHLFEEHADDLMACCAGETDQSCEKHGHANDCGCDNPVVQFFQNKEHFTDQKTFNIALLPIYGEFVVEIYGYESFNEQLTGKKIDWLKNPPPVALLVDNYIRFICKTKVPDIA